jgi:hypothetical protein
MAVSAATITINVVDGNGFVNGKNVSSGIKITRTSSDTVSKNLVGQTITLTLNGETYTGTIAANLTWLVNVPTADLAPVNDGQAYAAPASATDKRCNPASTVSSATVNEKTSFSIKPVDSDNVINAHNVANGITIGGATTDSIAANLVGQTVTVTLNGKAYTGTVQNDGTSSIHIGQADLAVLTDISNDTRRAIDLAKLEGTALKFQQGRPSAVACHSQRESDVGLKHIQRNAVPPIGGDCSVTAASLN